MQLQQRSIRRKRQQLLKLQGLSARLTREQVAPIVARLQSYHDRGMSWTAMGAQVGIGRSALAELVRSDRAVNLYTYEKLCRIKYEGVTKFGARISLTGTERRIRALFAAGFTTGFLGTELGGDEAHVGRVLRGRGGHTHAAYAIRVARMYEKLVDADPVELGVSAQGAKYAQNLARKRGYPPPMCWDPDTIDDPEAIPEWTGACGTSRGLHIHYRDGILPACGPCLATRQVETPAAGRCSSGFSGRQLKALRQKRGFTEVDFAQLVGVDKSTLYYWESGRSAPRSRDRLQQLCDLLGCMETDLTEEM